MCWNIKDFGLSRFTDHGNAILEKIYDPAGARLVDAFVIVEPYSRMRAFPLASLVTDGSGFKGVLALYFALKNSDLRWKVAPLRATAMPPVSDMVAFFYHSGVIDCLGPEALGGVPPIVTTVPSHGHPLPWNVTTDRWCKVRYYNSTGGEVGFFGRRPTLYHVGAPDRVTTPRSVTTIAPAAPLSIVTNLLPDGAAGQLYEVLLQADGGTPPYVWAQQPATTLPAGLAFNPVTQTLLGTPGASGPFQLAVTVTDVAMATVTVTLAFNIAAANAALAAVTTALPQALQGVPYRVRIVSQGGRGARAIVHAQRRSTDLLPPGLALARDGLLSGTPSTVGVATFDVDLSAEASTARDFTMDVSVGGGPLAVFSNALPDGVVGMPYEFRLQATGGVAPYAWVLNGGTTLVAGLAFDAVTGTLRGTPTAAGPCTLDIDAQDAVPTSVNTVLNFNIAATGAELGFVTAATLPRALLNAPYRMRLASTGGHGHRAVALAGTLPAGLSLEPEGVARTFTLTVATGGAGLAVFTNALPDGVVGVAYDFVVHATGGTAPYTWAQNPATVLVAGLAFNTVSGALTGTPGAAGACTLDVTVTDGAGNTVTCALGFTIAAAGTPLAWNTAIALPRALQNQPYRVRLASSGGYGPRSIELTGALPAGLTVDLDGLLVGTPTALGVNMPINVTMFDSSAVISGTPTAPAIAHIASVQLLDAARTFKLVAIHAPPQARYPSNRDCVRALVEIREITALRAGLSVAVCGDFNCCTHPTQNCGTHGAGEFTALTRMLEKGFVLQSNNTRSSCKGDSGARRDVYAEMNGTANDATLDAICTHSFDHALSFGFTGVNNVDVVNLVREDPGYAAAKVAANGSIPHPIKGIVGKWLWTSGVSDHLPVRFTLQL
jgi:hypothetical protein